MRIVLVAKPERVDTGVGRYVLALASALRALGHDVAVVHPGVPLPRWMMRAISRWPGFDLEAFFNNYPVWVRYPEADVYHFSSQNLATLLLFRRPKGKVVVTVHDILPFMLRSDKEIRPYRNVADRLFDGVAMKGLARADLLIADSWYTGRCIVEWLGIAREKLRVVWLAADRVRFTPSTPDCEITGQP